MEKKHHYCARFEPTLSPEEKVTFPMFKRVIEKDKRGDDFERFVELSEDEKKNLRASSPFVDVGNMEANSPLPRDKFEVLDEMMELVNSLTPEEIEELKQLKEE